MTTQTQSQETETTVVSIAKVKTNIAGLDEILDGGLAEGRTTLVAGGPGCGKSILGLEFLYRGALAGEAGIFVTFEEQADAVRKNALTLGYQLAPLEQTNTFFIMEVRLSPDALMSGGFNLKGLLAMLEAKATDMGAKRMVIDGVDVLLRIFNDPLRERNELYALHDWLNAHEMTALLTVKSSKDETLTTRYEFLDFMTDCVIRMDQRVTEQVTTRRLRVIKYRGSNFSRNEFPYVISAQGLYIISTTTDTLEHPAPGAKISSGQHRLDMMLDGGYRRGTCILISGTSGTGKTTVACIFARAACQRGEKVLYLSFEESAAALMAAMRSSGTDLRPAQDAGRLRFLTTLPESKGVEEHLLQVFNIIAAFQPDHLIVDAISAARRMGSEQGAFDYVIRLVNKCKQEGLTCYLINQTTGFQDVHEISGIGISSLVDTVLFLRYIEVGGETNRMFTIMKSRGSRHSNQYREFLITDTGIDIQDAYVGEGGVLTGTARQEQEARAAVENRRKEQRIKQQEQEVTRRHALLETQTIILQAELEAARAELDALHIEDQTTLNGRTIRADLRGKDDGNAAGGAK
jgi:circadian clock protein KaiC